jgi:hypothetical protein
MRSYFIIIIIYYLKMVGIELSRSSIDVVADEHWGKTP